mgnify:CR=1 FL=1
MTPTQRDDLLCSTPHNLVDLPEPSATMIGSVDFWVKFVNHPLVSSSPKWSSDMVFEIKRVAEEHGTPCLMLQDGEFYPFFIDDDETPSA